MPKRTSKKRGRTPAMDGLMQRVYDPKNAHLFTVESALAAIASSKAKRAKSILDLDGSLKPAEGLHVQIEDMNAWQFADGCDPGVGGEDDAQER